MSCPCNNLGMSLVVYFSPATYMVCILDLQESIFSQGRIVSLNRMVDCRYLQYFITQGENIPCVDHNYMSGQHVSICAWYESRLVLEIGAFCLAEC